MVSIATQHPFASNIAANRNRWLLETPASDRGEDVQFYVADHNGEVSFKEVLVKHDNITDIYTYMCSCGRPHKRM